MHHTKEGINMPKLIITTKKQNVYDEWIDAGPEGSSNFFTQEEITNVLNPYYEYVRNLPGHDLSKYKTYVNDMETALVREFDTVQNAQNALFKLSKYTDEPIVIARNNLVQERTKEHGVVYTFTNKII